jgi:hypothetical protein
MEILSFAEFIVTNILLVFIVPLVAIPLAIVFGFAGFIYTRVHPNKLSVKYFFGGIINAAGVIVVAALATILLLTIPYLLLTFVPEDLGSGVGAIIGITSVFLVPLIFIAVLVVATVGYLFVQKLLLKKYAPKVSFHKLGIATVSGIALILFVSGSIALAQDAYRNYYLFRSRPELEVSVVGAEFEVVNNLLTMTVKVDSNAVQDEYVSGKNMIAVLSNDAGNKQLTFSNDNKEIVLGGNPNYTKNELVLNYQVPNGELFRELYCELKISKVKLVNIKVDFFVAQAYQKQISVPHTFSQNLAPQIMDAFAEVIPRPVLDDC